MRQSTARTIKGIKITVVITTKSLKQILREKQDHIKSHKNILIIYAAVFYRKI